MGPGVRRHEDDVLSVVVVKQLRDRDDHVFMPLGARGRIAGETTQALFDPRILLGAPLPHGADEELQIFDRADEGALQLGLP